MVEKLEEEEEELKVEVSNRVFVFFISFRVLFLVFVIALARRFEVRSEVSVRKGMIRLTLKVLNIFPSSLL